MRLVELHLIRHSACAEFLVGGVLQVPAGLLLLHIFADHRVLIAILGFFRRRPPNFQVLDSIAIFVFGGALPGDDIRPQGREAQLENVGGWERGDDLAMRSINDRNPAEHVLERDHRKEWLEEAYCSGDAHAKYRLSGE
jgi:hypothetical protein